MNIRQYPAHSSNYTARNGRKINLLVVHHMAGRLTADQCGSIFAKSGRGGSAHYGIGYNGEINQYVKDKDIAWHAGNWAVNERSIGIECSNSSTGGNWPVSDVTINSLVELLAMKAREYGLGRLVVGQNLGYHSLYSQTYCPGEYMRSKMQEIANRVNQINYPPQPAPAPAQTAHLEYEKITPKKVRLIRDTNLWNFNFTKWSEAEAIKGYVVGDVIEAVAIAHNKTMNADYYMTAYSYNNGNIRATNGFNIKDCEDLPPETSQNNAEAPKPSETINQPTTPEKSPESENNGQNNDNSNASSAPLEETINSTAVQKQNSPAAPTQEEGVALAKENNTLLKKIVEMLSWVVEKIKEIFK